MKNCIFAPAHNTEAFFTSFLLLFRIRAVGRFTNLGARINIRSFDGEGFAPMADKIRGGGHLPSSSPVPTAMISSPAFLSQTVCLDMTFRTMRCWGLGIEIDALSQQDPVNF